MNLDIFLIAGCLILYLALGRVERRLRRAESWGTRHFLFNVSQEEEPWLRGAAHRVGYRLYITPYAFETSGELIAGHVGVYSCEPLLRSTAPLLEEFTRIAPRFQHAACGEAA